MAITKNTALLRQLVTEHVAADSVIQGDYLDENTHKGRFIGCLARSNEPSKACELFGLTVPILRIAEGIFEGLPKEEAVKFFSDFPDAIATDGKDLSLVHWKFLASELRHFLPKASNTVQKVIYTIILGIDLLASGEHFDLADADAAATARAARAARPEDAKQSERLRPILAAMTAQGASLRAMANALASAGTTTDKELPLSPTQVGRAADAFAAAADAADDAAAAADAAARSTVFMRQRDLLLNLIRQA